MAAVADRSPAVGVALLADLDAAQIDALLSAYGARLAYVPAGSAIPGSYWGETEAGRGSSGAGDPGRRLPTSPFPPEGLLLRRDGYPPVQSPAAPWVPYLPLRSQSHG